MRFLHAALVFGLLAGPLRAQCPDGSPPPCGARVVASDPPRSVAVLYFANHSSDTADAYLAEGITEGIIARLTHDSRLTVKSTSAVARLRGMSPPPDSAGRVLHVANLVGGTVARSGRRLRVSVELVRAATGTTLWAGQYDRDDADLFDIQTAIADSVAREITGRLLPARRDAQPRRPTTSSEAYDLFLQGNYRLSRRTSEDALVAIRDYEAATRLDPSFALAYARIALVSGVALDWGWASFDAESSIRGGLAASGRALELDSNLADAWTARAYMLRFANARTYAGVEEAFLHALRLAPRDPEANLQFGWALANLGRDDSALVVLRRALALDPDRPASRYTLGRALINAHRFDDAKVVLDTGIMSDPAVPNLRGLRAWARLLAGDTAGARADAVAEHSGSANVASVLASLAARSGDRAAALVIAEREAAGLPPTPAHLAWDAGLLAVGFAAADSAGRALDLLERIEPQGLQVWHLLQFPGFDAIRRDPRFALFEAELAPPGAKRP